MMTEKTLDLPGLAHSYRRLVLWVGIQILLSLVHLVVRHSVGTSLAVDLAILIVSLCLVLTVVMISIYGYRTARALGETAPWLWPIALLIPCVSLITLLVLSARATKKCREHGVRVGLLGPAQPRRFSQDR